MKKWLIQILLVLLVACEQYSYEYAPPEDELIQQGDTELFPEFKGDLKQYCSDLDGNFCERNEYCSETALAERCCSSECLPASMQYLSDNSGDSFGACSVPEDSCAKGDCKLIIAVDKEVNDELIDELNIWKQDIIKDLNVQIEFLVYPKNVIPFQIKSDIMKKSNAKIKGVIFVGDIPTIYYGRGFKDEIFPSDFYYSDFEGWCSDEYSKFEGYYDQNYYTEEIKEYYQGKSEECKKTSIYALPFWSGRMSPGTDKINNLRNYLKRNHEYRNGELSYDKKMLVFFPILEKAYDKNLEDFVDLNVEALYEEQNIKMIPLINDSEKSGKSSRMYLEELKKPYEYVAYNGHGLPLSHQINIESKDIDEAKPNALFYSLRSCSVGRFTVDEYIGGKYLFSGAGLVASAATTPIFTALGSIGKREAKSFANGLIFGEVHNILMTSSVSHLLGDPTLKMRNEKSKAIACLDSFSLDFGKIKPGEKIRRELKIYNKGFGNLSIEIVKKDFSNTTELNFISNYKCNGEIKPGESMDCFFNAGGIKSGRYQGIIYLITNNKDDKVVEIKYIGVQE